MTELWKDAHSKKFMATYGTLAGYEPELKRRKKKQLEPLLNFESSPRRSNKTTRSSS